VLGSAGVGDVAVAQLPVNRPSLTQMAPYTEAGVQHGFNVAAEDALGSGVNRAGIVVQTASTELEVRDPFRPGNLHKVPPQENVPPYEIIGRATKNSPPEASRRSSRLPRHRP